MTTRSATITRILDGDTAATVIAAGYPCRLAALAFTLPVPVQVEDVLEIGDERWRVVAVQEAEAGSVAYLEPGT